MAKVIITGEWDGQKIWRYQTSAELLQEEIAEMKLQDCINDSVK